MSYPIGNFLLAVKFEVLNTGKRKQASRNGDLYEMYREKNRLKPAMISASSLKAAYSLAKIIEG